MLTFQAQATEKALKVFVVDDEPVIATTLAAILRLNGFEATSFTVPFEALKAVASIHPHLVISDVMMPGLSGVDLALGIRATCPECHILLFSGQAATYDLLAEARAKGHHFTLIEKPVHPKDLLRIIRNMDPAHVRLQTA